MGEIYLKVLDQHGRKLLEQPLPLEGERCGCSLRLRNLPGASALYVTLADQQTVRLRAEIPAEGGESVLVQIQRDAESGLHLSVPSRKILTLAAGSRFEPAPPIQPAAADALDLALVVDGTSRRFFRVSEAGGEGAENVGRVASELLLGNQECKAALAERMCSFIRALAGRFADCRVAVLAFADPSPLDVAASDLIPEYLLYPTDPDHRILQALDAERIEARLLAMPPSSGGDFVDALADALYACCEELHWRPEARKMVLVYGDSPGHCILYPPPKGANACVRKHDVDVEAMHLHRNGVELVTVYNDPPPDLGLYDLVFQRDLLKYARDQYRRLASLPELAFLASAFDATAAAEVVSSLTGPIGRGASYGELIEILADSDLSAPG